MKSISGKDFARLLEKKGWELKRVKGSHRVYAKEGNPARISIPIVICIPLITEGLRPAGRPFVCGVRDLRGWFLIFRQAAAPDASARHVRRLFQYPIT